MAITTASGTKIFIGPVATDAVDTVAEFKALTGYVEVKKVESYGDFGDESAAVTLNTIGEGRIEKAKGSRDAGTLALTVAFVGDDPGQLAMEAAEKDYRNYAFQVLFPDGASQYFRGLVMSRRRNIGSANDVLKRVFNIGINSELFDAPASP